MKHIKEYKLFENLYTTYKKPFIKCIRLEKIDCVKKYIDDGLDVNGYDDTFNKYILKNGNFEIFKLFINNGFNVDLDTLINAFMYRKNNMFDYILKNGTNINLQNPITKKTILIHMALYSSLEYVIDILDYHPNWNIKNNKGYTFFYYLTDKEKEIIKEKYPENYENYILNKNIDDFNI